MSKEEREEKFKKGFPESTEILQKENDKRNKEGKHKVSLEEYKILKRDSNLDDETKEIMNYWGRFHSDGFISGKHMTTILSYLFRKQTEDYDKTKKKLTSLCGISQRYIQESYLDGIESWGIIEVKMDNYCHRIWHWVGIKALKNNGSE